MSFIVARWNHEKSGPLQRLPVWAFHGAKDPVVPMSESEQMVGALKQLGGTEVSH
jgi:predicted peptidase